MDQFWNQAQSSEHKIEYTKSMTQNSGHQIWNTKSWKQNNFLLCWNWKQQNKTMLFESDYDSCVVVVSDGATAAAAVGVPGTIAKWNKMQIWRANTKHRTHLVLIFLLLANITKFTASWLPKFRKMNPNSDTKSRRNAIPVFYRFGIRFSWICNAKLWASWKKSEANSKSMSKKRK